MSLFRRILLLAIIFSLTGCGENIEPLVPQEDYATSATGKKELVLYATRPIFESDYMFQFRFAAPAGSDLSIDWGDGTSDNYSLNGYLNLEKAYDAPGRYKVTVTGDIEQITSLRLVYSDAANDSIDVSGLRNLEDLMVALTVGPKVIDISRNRKLRDVSLSSTIELIQVILPVRHRITSFGIDGPNKMTTAEVDYVINNIYTNAVKGNIHDGVLGVKKELFGEGNEMVGPPSPSSVTKLKTLQNVYGWEVNPIQY
jgi:hypothetical protein